MTLSNRGTILNQVKKKCSRPAARVALVGLGGVGKSQLAIEHCYRTQERNPGTWVFWVHVGTAARLEQGYRDIAEQVKLPGRKDTQADIFKLVHDWLRNERNGWWLLVLDNADDADVLGPSSTGGCNSALRQPLSHSLPPSRHGSVLVTSRTTRAALRIVEERDVLQIEPMDARAAQALLHKKLGNNQNRDDVAELGEALEFMPLALAQAAAYIRKRMPRYSVRQYLDRFYENDQHKTSLLNHDAGQLRRDAEAKNSTITSWQITFNHLLATRKSAADRLSLMSFFDRQAIPAALLRYEAETTSTREIPEDRENTTLLNSDEDFEKDILVLREYSLISQTTATATDVFEMHSLVQLATRKWLESQNLLNLWRERYIKNLRAAFPTGKFENWNTCRDLYPHVKSSLSQRPESEESLLLWADMLCNAAWFICQQGHLDDAETLSLLALHINKKLLGKRDLKTLDSMHVLAIVHQQKGQYKEAKQLQVRVREARSKLFGERHPDTLKGMSNLGLTYYTQGQWKEAEWLQEQVLQLQKEVLGERHPETLRSMSNLGLTYYTQWRWKEAERLQEQVLQLQKEVLGERHLDTLRSMSNLCLTYIMQGRWKEAEQLQEQVLQLQKEVLGKRHLQTLRSMYNLGLSYSNQGWWKEAEQLQVQVLHIQKEVLGERHLDTLRSISSLALTYMMQRQWKKAEQLQVQVLQLQKEVLGERHPETLRAMNNLACTWSYLGCEDDARSLMRECVLLRQQVLGPEHPFTVGSLNSLNIWEAQDQRREEDEQTEHDEPGELPGPMADKRGSQREGTRKGSNHKGTRKNPYRRVRILKALFPGL